MRPNIALIGKARSGKDTIASRLVGEHGYTRVAFADKLKEAVLRTDPYVNFLFSSGHERLSHLLRRVGGWEPAKEMYPEVRRLLQQYGQSVRRIDPAFWVNAAMREIDYLRNAVRPVVVSDVRYANEAHALLDAGFRFVRVVRPGTGGDPHVSENELNDWMTDWIVYNDGTVDDLHRHVDRMPYAL